MTTAQTEPLPQKQQNGNGQQNKPALVAGSGGPAAIIPRDIEQAFRLANAIAAANMAPKAYNRDANAIMIGIMHGMEVGLPPMAALQSIAVINGMPTIWGDGALALVRGSGFLEDFSESLHGEGEKMEAICKVKRKGQESEIVRTFSAADAKQAQLWGKAGPWTQYPKRMLQMRARSWALRDGFADVLRGLRVREEVQDMGFLEAGPDGTYRPARPTRDDYQAAARHQGTERAVQQQAREIVNAERTAMGKPPLDDEEIDTETGEITAATEPETAADPATDGPVPFDDDEPGEETGDEAEAEQRAWIENYHAQMSEQFAACTLQEEVAGAWGQCKPELAKRGVHEGHADFGKFQRLYSEALGRVSGKGKR